MKAADEAGRLNAPSGSSGLVKSARKTGKLHRLRRP